MQQINNIKKKIDEQWELYGKPLIPSDETINKIILTLVDFWITICWWAKRTKEFIMPYLLWGILKCYIFLHSVNADPPIPDHYQGKTAVYIHTVTVKGYDNNNERVADNTDKSGNSGNDKAADELVELSSSDSVYRLLTKYHLYFQKPRFGVLRDLLDGYGKFKVHTKLYITYSYNNSDAIYLMVLDFTNKKYVQFIEQGMFNKRVDNSILFGELSITPRLSTKVLSVGEIDGKLKYPLKQEFSGLDD